MSSIPTFKSDPHSRDYDNRFDRFSMFDAVFAKFKQKNEGNEPEVEKSIQTERNLNELESNERQQNFPPILETSTPTYQTQSIIETNYAETTVAETELGSNFSTATSYFSTKPVDKNSIAYKLRKIFKKKHLKTPNLDTLPTDYVLKVFNKKLGFPDLNLHDMISNLSNQSEFTFSPCKSELRFSMSRSCSKLQCVQKFV